VEGNNKKRFLFVFQAQRKKEEKKSASNQLFLATSLSARQNKTTTKVAQWFET